MTPGKENSTDKTTTTPLMMTREKKKKEMHVRYGSMDTIDRLEVDLGSPFDRGGAR